MNVAPGPRLSVSYVISLGIYSKSRRQGGRPGDPLCAQPHLPELHPERQRARTQSCLAASPAEMQAEPLGTTRPPFAQL